MTVALKVEGICQACMRVRPFASYTEATRAKCQCGGDFCACDGCQEGIARARAGDFSGLRHAVFEWTAWDGVLSKIPEAPTRDGHEGPEKSMFHALGLSRGWETTDHPEDETVEFLVDLNPEDQATIGMQYDRFFDPGLERMVGGLSAHVHLYPEGCPVPADPDDLARTLAGWLRELADKLSPPSGLGGPA